jgi:UPF0755 protein
VTHFEQTSQRERGISADDSLDDASSELPPARHRRRTVRTVLGVLLVCVLVVAVVGALWFRRQVDPPGPPGEEVVFEIPTGTSTNAIGDLLEAEGIIESAFVWKNWYVRVKGIGPFEAGTYNLRERSSIDDVVAALDDGPAPPPFLEVTVPEGLTVPEVLQRLVDAEGRTEPFELAELEQVLDSGQVRSAHQPVGQPSMEGFLFPDTYRFEPDVDAVTVLKTLVGETDAVLTELDVASAPSRFNLTPYEIMVVASLIEEETRVDAERGKVARVIYNRLRDGIPLGVDATSRYEAELAGRDRDDIDFESTSPYNTRRIPGLPPTPIASPGRASIEAALNPADGPWIYYVLADEEGNHFFTESASEFERAKAECAAKDLGCG